MYLWYNIIMVLVYLIDFELMQLISVCFQELAVHFDYHNNTHCSCPIQGILELNQPHFLIISESINNCSKCLNAPVYTIYVKTDGGTVSNSLMVTHFQPFPTENSSESTHLVISQTS